MSRRDLAPLKALSIVEVAHSLGCNLAPCGSGVWGMRDPEQPRELTSLRVFEKTNTFKRFSEKLSGGVSGGDTIAFVQHIQDCNFKDAIQFLSDRFL